MRPTDIIIDTQLLVLLIVGNASTEIIKRHKRVHPKYDEQAYDLLRTTLGRATRIVVTPNVLAETSNLIRQTAEPDRTSVMTAFHALFGKFEEMHVPGEIASTNGTFFRLGLTDAALLEVGDGSSLLLTDDFDLYMAASHAGRQVMNFNHAREASR